MCIIHKNCYSNEHSINCTKQIEPLTFNDINEKQKPKYANKK